MSMHAKFILVCLVVMSAKHLIAGPLLRRMKGEIRLGGRVVDLGENYRLYRAFADGDLASIKLVFNEVSANRPIFNPFILSSERVISKINRQIKLQHEGIDATKVFAFPPLGLACRLKKYYIAKYLISIGAEVNDYWYEPAPGTHVGYPRETPMLAAVKNDDLAIVMLLMRSGFVFDPEGKDVRQLLSAAVRFNRTKTLSYLIGKGVQLTVREAEFEVFRAFRSGNWTGLRELIRASKKWKLPIVWDDALVGVMERKNIDMIEPLIRAGASPQSRDREGRSVLYIALYKLNFVGARTLVSLGAKLRDIRDIERLKRILVIRGVDAEKVLRELRRIRRKKL